LAVAGINVPTSRRDCFHKLVHFLPKENFNVLIYLVKVRRAGRQVRRFMGLSS